MLVLTAALLLLVAGTYTASKMDVDVFPDLTAPTVVVMTEAHGMAPEEVEQLVTFPLETAVNGASAVRRVRSSSSAGFSIVWVEFDWGTDIYRARQVVNEKISTVAGRLPEGANLPVMAPQSSIMGEIMLISVTGRQTGNMELRSIAEWQIRPLLLSVGGVSQVSVTGGDYKQYQILASPEKMKFYSVSWEELGRAAKESNMNAAGGFLQEYGNEYIIRGIGRTGDIAEIGRSLIRRTDGKPVLIQDVAEVRTGPSVKIGEGSLKGVPAVILTVQKQPGANTLELTDKIDKSISVLKNGLPEDVEINTRIFRQSDFIEASVSNIRNTLLEGSVFVVLVLILFLMNWRPTLISLTAIPVSLITAIFVLKWMGFTINTMSLGGMAIAIGDLVDDAIIDVENVYKRLRENAQLPPGLRKKRLLVIYNASVEIRSSVISATFIIIVAFLPLFFLSGMEGRLLAPLGISFIVSLFASLVVAITITPVLCSYLFPSSELKNISHRESWLVRKLKTGYGWVLVRALQYKKTIVGISVALFAAAIFLLAGLGRSFLPEFNEGSLVVSVTSLPGISLAESNKIGNLVEKTLLSIPEVSTTTRRTGRAELDEHAQGVNASEIDAPFKLKNRNRESFLKEVREKMSGISGASITIGQPISHRIDHMLSGTRANIAIKIFGPDLEKLYSLSNEVKRAVENTNGLVDLAVEQQIQIPQVQIKANRDMLGKYGITTGEFAAFTDMAFAGEKVSEIFEGNKRFDLIVKLEDASRNQIDKIGEVLMDTRDGQKIPLNYVASVVSVSGPHTINRENVQRKTVVSANVAGRDQKSVVAEIRQKIEASVRLPLGYRIEYGGQFEAEAAASQRLLIASAVSLLVIFFLLFLEFRSFSLAAIILINLPLALIGGVAGVWLTSGMLSIPALIGFITLFGIATRNGILLVSHYKTLLQQDVPLTEAILRGSLDRLSPILMTALTAGLALIPLALNGDLAGNEIQSPMAKVILGGLLSSTLLNLFVIPVVFILTKNRKQKKHAE